MDRVSLASHWGTDYPPVSPYFETPPQTTEFSYGVMPLPDHYSRPRSPYAAAGRDYYNASHSDTLAVAAGWSQSNLGFDFNHDIDLERSYTFTTSSSMSPFQHSLSEAWEMDLNQHSIPNYYERIEDTKTPYWKLRNGIESSPEFPPYIFPNFE
jgi:hypothetical protein